MEKSLDALDGRVYLTGGFVVRGSLAALRNLRQLLLEQSTRLGLTLVYHTLSSEKLFVVHESAARAALNGDPARLGEVMRRIEKNGKREK